MSASVVWAVWLILFGLFEGAALIDRRVGDTLSEQTRAWFRTNTPRGRVIFGVGWVGFASWFLWHILWQ